MKPKNGLVAKRRQIYIGAQPYYFLQGKKLASLGANIHI